MDPPPTKRAKLSENGFGRPVGGSGSGQTVTCRVKAPQEDELPPIVMSFPQGPPPNGVLNDGEKGLSFNVYKVADEKKRNKRMDVRGIAPDFPVQYNGSTEGPSPSDASYKYCVGLYNRKTNTVQLVPTPSLFTMTQSVEGQGNSISERKYGDLDYIAQRSMLINTFASSRRRRMLTTMVANRVNDQTSFGVEVIDITPTAAATAAESRSDLPPFDLTATTVDQVYPFNSLVPVDEIDFIIMSQAPCIKALDDTTEASTLKSSLPSSTASILQALISAVAASRATSSGHTIEQHQRRAALLQYLVYLMTVFKMQEGNHHKIIRPTAEKQIPSTILDGILTRFASSVPGDKKKFILSAAEISKLLNFISIIALTLNNFSIQINRLAEDLRLTPSQLRTHFELAGCKITLPGGKRDGEVSVASQLMAKLSAPLELPDQAKRPSKRK